MSLARPGKLYATEARAKRLFQIVGGKPNTRGKHSAGGSDTAHPMGNAFAQKTR